MDLVEDHGRTPLMYSAMAEHEECVAVLLRHGALITSQDNNGQTALHWAALTVSHLGCACGMNFSVAHVVYSVLCAGELQVFEDASCSGSRC